MTPGLSLFYGGLVQSKNVLNTVMQSMANGYRDFHMGCIRIFIKFWNGKCFDRKFRFNWTTHVGFAVNDQLSPHIPFALFMLFQMMFCTIAVSILSGSIVNV